MTKVMQTLDLARHSRRNVLLRGHETGKRTSLQIADEEQAQRIIQSKNEALQQSAINLQIAKAHPQSKNRLLAPVQNICESERMSAMLVLLVCRLLMATLSLITVAQLVA